MSEQSEKSSGFIAAVKGKISGLLSQLAGQADQEQLTQTSSPVGLQGRPRGPEALVMLLSDLYWNRIMIINVVWVGQFICSGQDQTPWDLVWQHI